MGAHTYINIYQKIDVVTFIKKGYLLIGADQNGKSQLEDTEYTVQESNPICITPDWDMKYRRLIIYRKRLH